MGKGSNIVSTQPCLNECKLPTQTEDYVVMDQMTSCLKTKKICMTSITCSLDDRLLLVKINKVKSHNFEMGKGNDCLQG
jgi:hypothetical protein